MLLLGVSVGGRDVQIVEGDSSLYQDFGMEIPCGGPSSVTIRRRGRHSGGVDCGQQRDQTGGVTCRCWYPPIFAACRSAPVAFASRQAGSSCLPHPFVVFLLRYKACDVERGPRA